MNIKNFMLIGMAAVATSVMALDFCEVTGVKARQRYPWNGLVDIDFTLDSKATEPYLMNVTVFDNVGKTNLPVKTVYAENVSQKANPCMVAKDTTRIVWDAAMDLPDGFKCTNVLVTCQDARCTPSDKLYCVIDLSAEGSASENPVSYLDSVPAGGWSDVYKRTKMVFRRIEPGDFMMGSPASEIGRSSNEVYHLVKITKPYYISVFELTESQYAHINGETSNSKRAKLLPYDSIRGPDFTNANTPTEYSWPTSRDVKPSSLVGKLRAKSGISSCDLPTEAQWEYAARGGSMTAINIGGQGAEIMTIAGRYRDNCEDGKGDAAYATWTDVGSYLPNAWGLYDMLGNAQEWVVDAWEDFLGTEPISDPVGNSTPTYKNMGSGGRDVSLRTAKGGGFCQYANGTSRTNTLEDCAALSSCRAAYRTVQYSPDGAASYSYRYAHLNAVRIVFLAE